MHFFGKKKGCNLKTKKQTNKQQQQQKKGCNLKTKTVILKANVKGNLYLTKTECAARQIITHVSHMCHTCAKEFLDSNLN